MTDPRTNDSTHDSTHDSRAGLAGAPPAGEPGAQPTGAPDPAALAAAYAALAQAQTQLEALTADAARLDEFLDWLPQALARAGEFEDFYVGPGQGHIETILTADPMADTPAVANEDSAWEALADLETRMMRLLRLVTAQLTRPLDQPAGACCR
ncbi:MAG: hypothetical protein LCH98_02225 [Actinobacteria bacterium]|nr:hypothetical protein [Actinomycetota bacterium]